MPRSKLEQALDDILKEIYPHDQILEDWAIKVRGKTLFVDRVIKGAKIAFEIDGRQHSEFIAHFHKDADGFAAHKERDRLKSLWLEANGYSLVRLSYKDNLTVEFVRKKILEALQDE